MRPPPKSAFVLPDADSEDSIDEDEDWESDEDEDSETSYDVPELVSDGEEEESDEDEEAESDYDWESDGDSDDWETDDESSERWGKIPFLKDAENVEFPVSNEEFPLAWLAGRIEVRKPTVRSRFDPHFMLYLVGDELGDGGSTSGAGAGVQDVVCPTLPEEVVEAVLLRLPAAGQARCRAVCRAWLALLTNPEFLRRSFLQSFSQTMPPLCAVRYCPKERYKAPWERLRRRPRFKGLKVDISFLPEVFHSSCSELHNCSPCGFMCISRLVDEGMLLCVLNPVNQSFRVLPLLQKLWGYHVVLLMETASATGSIPSFKVFVSGVGPVPISRRPISRKFYKDVAVYSSISGEWTGFLGRPDVETSDPPAFCCNGDLYTTVDSTPARLVRLSTEPGPGYLWDVALPTFEARRGEHWMSEFFLASHRGRLLCICGGIWMLDDESQLWVGIAGKCPPDMLPPTHPKTQAWLKSVHVCGDLVVFFYQVGVNRCDRNMVHPVAYDMLRRFWRKAPSVIAQYGDVFQPMPNLRL